MSPVGPPRRPAGSEPLLVATSSADKLAEIRRILGDLPRPLIGLADLPGGPPPEPDEPFHTFLENARHKAEHYARHAGLPTLADDSGLSVDALDGAPGVLSKRFAGRDELSGADLDGANNAHLLERLHGVPPERRAARYTCAAVLARADRPPIGALGSRAGRILEEPRGAGGFGYDPLFLLPEHGVTFGELPQAEKNRTSHRARAFRALRAALGTLGFVFLAFALVLAVAPSSAGAQVVTGRIAEPDGSPLAGAFVALADSAGRDVAATLSHPDGAFSLQSPRPGTFTLRVERIGFATAATEPFRLLSADTLRHVLTLPPQAVPLAALRVEGEERCQLPRESAAAAARIWDEARKALRVTAWASRQQVFRLRLVATRRMLDPESLRPLDSQERPSVGYHAGSPYVSLPAEDLAREGYVRGGTSTGWTFYAPDADVLLSDHFLDAHCFRAVTASDGERRLVGLAFEPIRGRSRHSDVRGTLWLDAATAELRTLEFGYTSLPLQVGSALAGGRVDFGHLPSGAWYVRSWWIRFPELSLTRGADGIHRYGIRRVLETGGRVTRVRTPAGDLVPSGASH